MTVTGVVLLALVQAVASPPAPDVGVAAAEAGQHCVALSGPSMDVGSPVTLITPTEPQRAYRAVVVRTVTNCAILSQHYQSNRAIYFLLAPDAGSEPLPDLAVAVKGRPDVRLAGGEVRVRLTDRILEARVRTCASSEGLHLTVWSGPPLKSVRLWHAYWYLGYDVEPNCQPGDYREGG